MEGICEKCGNRDQDEAYCAVEGCPWKGLPGGGDEDVADPVPDVVQK